MVQESHRAHLLKCIDLARQTMSTGNPPFASLLVLDGKVVIEAVNTTRTDDNFLHHGEMNLLWKASQQMSEIDLKRAVVYASSEPCPMCAGAIYWSGVRSLVFGCSRDSLTKVRQFGLNVPCRDILTRGTDHFDIIGPLCEDVIVGLYAEYYSKGSVMDAQ